MNRNYWRGFIALLWFALPVVGLRYWLVWDRLPVRMASHFDAAGNATAGSAHPGFGAEKQVK